MNYSAEVEGKKVKAKMQKGVGTCSVENFGSFLNPFAADAPLTGYDETIEIIEIAPECGTTRTRFGI